MTKEYKHTICRGSMELGNGCGNCEKCNDEVIEKYTAHIKKQKVVENHITGECGWVCSKCGSIDGCSGGVAIPKEPTYEITRRDISDIYIALKDASSRIENGTLMIDTCIAFIDGLLRVEHMSIDRIKKAFTDGL